jgi:quercetin dioxygenase-like cupin family protein
VSGIVNSRDEVEPDVTPFGSLRWLVNGDRCPGTALTAGEVTIRRGCKNPLHRHVDAEEILFLIEGVLEHRVGEETYTLRAGDVLGVPRGVPHGARSVGEVDARMVVAYDNPHRSYEVIEEDWS